MNQQRFNVLFHKDAQKEYERLDSSVVTAVNKAVDELEERADEVGKPLGNTTIAKLAGCKEIKLRELGIRIVFRIRGGEVLLIRIVEVLAIGKRERELVFKAADKRLRGIKKKGKADLK